MPIYSPDSFGNLTATSIFDLVKLADKSIAAKRAVECELRARYARVVRPFVTHLDKWVALCLSTGTVLSGSLALFFAAVTGGWVPRDGDVYVAFSHYKVVLNFLKEEEGYEVAWSGLPASAVRTEYDRVGGMLQVTKLKREDGRVLDIICSKTDTAELPIGLFWGTVVMNTLSPVRFQCAYPGLLEEKLCVACPVGHASSTDVRALKPAVEVCVAKYTTRGFTCTDDKHDLPLTLRDSVDMFATRSFGDGGCLKVEFGRRQDVARESPAKWRASWRLGGWLGKEEVKPRVNTKSLCGEGDQAEYELVDLYLDV